ncbi:uncharacterized protein LOC122808457 [Protopterus annectens]|uniref:uncharacterized protein LOC122808457 n=1 Tax=Protopterus annectens TaxID=7888 RepID=UPI001CFBA232|nr:uncharacterized protein LOC122808457 [Protopterus annectens]
MAAQALLRKQQELEVKKRLVESLLQCDDVAAPLIPAKIRRQGIADHGSSGTKEETNQESKYANSNIIGNICSCPVTCHHHQWFGEATPTQEAIVANQHLQLQFDCLHGRSCIPSSRGACLYHHASLPTCAVSLVSPLLCNGACVQTSQHLHTVYEHPEKYEFTTKGQTLTSAPGHLEEQLLPLCPFHQCLQYTASCIQHTTCPVVVPFRTQEVEHCKHIKTAPPSSTSSSSSYSVTTTVPSEIYTLPSVDAAISNNESTVLYPDGSCNGTVHEGVQSVCKNGELLIYAEFSYYAVAEGEIHTLKSV